jgi:hypothetical protein
MKVIPSPFSKISKKSIKNMMLSRIQEPNSVLNVGIFHENMGSIPQVSFARANAIREIDNNNGPDSSYNSETGKGSIYIPAYKDYYTGEPTA